MNLTNYDLAPSHKKSDSNMTSQYANNNIPCSRQGENADHIRFRANRIFSIGTDWYFSTREGVNKGPFESKREAENAINSFIRKIAFNLIKEEALLT